MPWLSPEDAKKPGTTLVEIRIGHIRDAHEIIGMQPEGFSPVSAIPQYSASECGVCPLCWVSIPEGFSAIVTRWGATIEGDEKDASWSPGFHCFMPWHKVSRLVSRQLQIFDTPVKDVKTKDHITVNIDVLVLFEIVNAMDFVYGLGVAGLDQLLRAAQEEEIRQIASETAVEEIFDLSGQNTDVWTQRMNSSFEKFGIEIKSFTVKNVSIPEDMAASFESKTLYESRTMEKEKQQEKDTQELNNLEEKQKLKEVCENKKMAAEENMTTTKARMSMEVRKIMAQTDKDIAKMETEKTAEVDDIVTNSHLEIARLHAEIMRLRRETHAQAEAECDKLEVEARAYECKQHATSKVEQAAKLAEGKKAVALAEGEATDAFASRRALEQELARLLILEHLGENYSVHITSTLENNTGLAPNNSIVSQVTQQGMEAARIKLADVTSTSAAKLGISKAFAGGLVRPLPEKPQQEIMP